MIANSVARPFPNALITARTAALTKSVPLFAQWSAPNGMAKLQQSIPAGQIGNTTNMLMKVDPPDETDYTKSTEAAVYAAAQGPQVAPPPVKQTGSGSQLSTTQWVLLGLGVAVVVFLLVDYNS